MYLIFCSTRDPTKANLDRFMEGGKHKTVLKKEKFSFSKRNKRESQMS